MSRQKSEIIESGLPSEQEEAIQQNLKFCYNSKVKITNGFYKGYKGTIKDFKHKKYGEGKFETIEIFYIVDIEGEKKTITINENSLKKDFRIKIPFTK